MIWDLTPLVDDPRPDAIAQRMRGIDDDWERFEAAYDGAVGSLDAEGILRLLRERDEMRMRQEPCLLYCKLRHSLEGGNDETERLYQLSAEAQAKEARSTEFLTIELSRRLSQDPSLIRHPSLTEYRHYLERMLRGARHVMPKEVERTLVEMELEAAERYRLYGDSLGRLRFDLGIEGRMYQISLAELEGFLGDTDRGRRMEAYRALGRALSGTEPLWTECISAIFESHLEMCRARGHPTPIEPTLLANDIDELTFRMMMACLEENAPLSRGYYSLKARLLGLDRLCDCDVLAPLPDSADHRWRPEEAKEIIVSALGGFDREWGGWAKEMFEKGQVDLVTRPGKEPGASCDEWLSGGGAFIMSNFHGRLLDMFQLAHELGHAIHARSYGRLQNPSNCQVSLCIAETCSTLAEFALAEHLLRGTRDEGLRRGVLCYELDSFAFTMLSIPARMRFEDAVFRELGKGTKLDSSRTAGLWREAWMHYHGPEIMMLQDSGSSWAMVSQFFEPGGRYYTYPYVFGELLALSILRRCREEGQPFHDDLRRFLEAGSSQSVEDMAGRLGFDIRKGAFWQGGFEEARGLFGALSP